LTSFDPAQLLRLPPRDTIATHTERDVMLYALGVGVGVDARTGAEALRFAYEAELAVLPTMAVVMASPGFWLREPQYGVDWKRVLHAEESLEVHRPLPANATLTSRLAIDDIVDKGRAVGAILYSRRELYDACGAHLATERRASLLRGDGGKGGTGNAARAPHPEPVGEPHAAIEYPTSPSQALLYRLSGDRNPLHADPAVAEAAGFRGPILHGLCTYAIAARGLLRALCDNDPARLRRIDCRFSAPVYSGETIRVEVWREGAGHASFRAIAAERGAVVLKHGFAQYD
jgi:acyl dehydratase